jgi:TolA-binding protein
MKEKHNMNRKSTAWILFSLVMLHAAASYSQETGYKWGIGVNAGGQKLYGDSPSTAYAPGFEGLVNYRVLSFADLTFALGYSQLKYDLVPGLSNTSNVINADLKGNFDLISEGVVRPFVGLGFGLANFHVGRSGRGRFNDAVFIGGGGVKVRIASQFDWVFGADYRFTTGDSFDNVTLNGQGTSNDGFLNLRTGINYNIPTRQDQSYDVIADQRAPLYEVNGESESGTGQDAQDVDMENMEEYVQLKSKVDALSQTVEGQDQEIDDLQKKVSDKKQELSTMEKDAANQEPVELAKNSSMSGFSEIYKEALTNYYNKNHTEAIGLFELLLKQYPDHALASNCQFWVGQSLFALHRYDESIAAFSKVLGYERSLKKDDSLFFLGRAYLKTGSGDRAKESFTRLVTNYPTSEYLGEAKDYIEKL